MLLQKNITEKESEFQTLVLNVMSHEIIPDLGAHRDKKVNNDFKSLLHEPLEVLRSSNSWSSNLSQKQTFCWGILGSCCSMITVSAESFEWLHSYSSIIVNLSTMFNHYCKSLKDSGDQMIIATEIPSGIFNHSSADMKRYTGKLGM